MPKVIKHQNLFRTSQEMDRVYQQRFVNNKVNNPYLVRFVQNIQMLTLFDCRHSNDANDHQNKLIEKRWRLFVELDNKPKIAFCEGGLRPLEETRVAAIVKYSEPG